MSPSTLETLLGVLQKAFSIWKVMKLAYKFGLLNLNEMLKKILVMSCGICAGVVGGSAVMAAPLKPEPEITQRESDKVKNPGSLVRDES